MTDSENHGWTCPTCKYDNPASARFCIECGAPAPPKTLTVQQKPPTKPMTPLPRPSGPKAAGWALYIKDYADPLSLDSHKKTVLGRQTATTSFADLIDLSEYNAYQLGVSRQHAEITCYDQHAMLKDLGSANGTWLNGQRLVPHQAYSAKDGDQINLGRLECLLQVGEPE